MQKLLRNISYSVMSFAVICTAQMPAAAHYDLQDHLLYESSLAGHHANASPSAQKRHSHAGIKKHFKSRHKKTAKSKAVQIQSKTVAKTNTRTVILKTSQVHHHEHKKTVAESSSASPWHTLDQIHKKEIKVHATTGSARALQNKADFNPWKLLEFAMSPAYAFAGRVSIVMQGPFRVIRSNGIPDHATGEFPNEGNPNTISEQRYEYRVPKEPEKTGQSTPLGMSPFGVAINGVPFDPGAAEWWQNNPRSGWQYEAMFLGARLGLDQNNAHVQPNGAYHYHGIPTGLMQKLSAHGKPVLIGYAADGFPIYGPYGYKNAQDRNSGLKKLRSSYRLKNGSRPTNPGPGGRYDGAFTADYEYVRGLGDLDDCNGLFGITPEYPQGIYHYIVTDAFPYIPRGYKGTPDESFIRRRPPGGMVRPGGGPGFGPPGRDGEEDGQAAYGPPGRPPGPPPGFDGQGGNFPPPPPPGMRQGGQGRGQGREAQGDDWPPPGGPGHGPPGRRGSQGGGGMPGGGPPDGPPPFGPPGDGPPPFPPPDGMDDDDGGPPPFGPRGGPPGGGPGFRNGDDNDGQQRPPRRGPGHGPPPRDHENN